MPPRSTSEESGVARSLLLLLATIVSVFWTYGFFWAGGNPFTHYDIALDSALFSASLMAILLTHEMAHYTVARMHGFRLSLPYFIPLPLGVGTLGAIIRLRSLPRSRTALLEMGAAGPLAGAMVAFFLLTVGLPMNGPPVAAESLGEYHPFWELLSGWANSLLGVSLFQQREWLPGTDVVYIFNDPLVVKLIGTAITGAPPDRYAELHPVALAGWIGCLLTAINLLPIGQLDGGHVAGAIWPNARRRSRVLLGLVSIMGLLAWPGWLIWSLLIYKIGAWRSLSVPSSPSPSLRARLLAAASLLVFVLTFMPTPIEMELMSFPVAAQDSVEAGTQDPPDRLVSGEQQELAHQDGISVESSLEGLSLEGRGR